MFRRVFTYFKVLSFLVLVWLFFCIFLKRMTTLISYFNDSVQNIQKLPLGISKLFLL